MRCVRVTVFGVALIALASLWAPASAGPWAREAGAGFVSLQISAEEAPNDVLLGEFEPETFFSFYGEYGLGRSLTLAVDLGQGEVSSQGMVILRYTLTPPDADWQLAVDAGLGLQDDGGADGSEPLVRFGASIGRGFGAGGGAAWYMPIRHRGGWLTVDALAMYNLQDAEPIWQTEATGGLRLNDRFAAIVSVKAEDWPNADLLVSVSPSILYDLSDRTSIRLGARAAVTGSDQVGLSLSLWHDF